MVTVGAKTMTKRAPTWGIWEIGRVSEGKFIVLVWDGVIEGIRERRYSWYYRALGALLGFANSDKAKVVCHSRGQPQRFLANRWSTSFPIPPH